MIKRLFIHSDVVLSADTNRVGTPEEYGFRIVSPSNRLQDSVEYCRKAAIRLMFGRSSRVTVQVINGVEHRGVTAQHNPVVVLSVDYPELNQGTSVSFTSMESLDAFIGRLRKAGEIAFHVDGHQGEGI